MDKYEYKVRSEEIKALIGRGEYEQAAELADTIDWRRVKSVMMLCTISDLYKINRRLEDARDMLLLAYDRHPGGRTIVYSLCEITIKMGEVVQAVEYYKEFLQIAPKDSGRYILQYKLYEAQGVSLEELIEVLEDLKKHDYREKWAYELALLYHKAGMEVRCVEECEELILWFGEGKYVTKARELKMLHQTAASNLQQSGYSGIQGDAGYAGMTGGYGNVGYGVPGYGQEVYGGYPQGSGQEAYGGYPQGSGQEVYGGYPQGDGPEAYGGYPQGANQEVYGNYPQNAYMNGGDQSDYETGYSNEEYDSTYNSPDDNGGDSQNINSGTYNTENYSGPGYNTSGYGNSGYHTEAYMGNSGHGNVNSYPQGTARNDYSSMEYSSLPETQDDEMDIHVKTVNVGQFDTINLQKELAEGLKEVLGEKDDSLNPVSHVIVETVTEPDNQGTTNVGAPENIESDIPETEVFFGETGELSQINRAEEPEQVEYLYNDGKERNSMNAHGNVISYESAVRKNNVSTDTGEIVMEQLRQESLVPFKEGQSPETAADSVAVTGIPKGVSAAKKYAAAVQEVGKAPAETPEVGKTPVVTPKIVKTPAEAPGVSKTVPVSQEKRKPVTSTSGIGKSDSGPATVVHEGTVAPPKTAQQSGKPKQHSVSATPYLSEPPRELANVLSMESDGQLSIVLPEKDMIEKQITGQLSIEDVLAEWERMKKDNEEKRKEAVRKRVIEHTGAMFTEFEAAVRDGLLEKLEGQKLDDQALKEAEKAAANDVLLALGKSEDNIKRDRASVAANTVKSVAGTAVTAVEAYGSDSLKETEVDGYSEEWKEDAEGQTPQQREQEAEYDTPEEQYTVPEAEDDSSEEYPGYDAEEGDPGEWSEQSDETDSRGENQEQDPEEEFQGEDGYEAVEEADEELLEDDGSTGGYAPLVVPGQGADKMIGGNFTQDDRSGEVDTGYLPLEGIDKALKENPEKKADEEERNTKKVQQNTQKKQTGEQRKQQKAQPEPVKEEAVHDKAHVRNLTREERELFSSFVQNKVSRERLVTALDNISLAAYTGNVIVTGDEGMDAMALAKNMIRYVQMNDSNFSGKIAKITGAALNGRDTDTILGQLKNGALIIQKASEMKNKTAETLYKGLQQESLGIIIILEDTKKAMNKFLEKNTDLAECFTARMDMEALSNEALVSFGLKYARELEYSIDEMGVLALHTRIEDQQSSDHIVTVMEVKEIVDDAIRHANRKTLGHFFDILLAKRYDEEDMIILRENDFLETGR